MKKNLFYTAIVMVALSLFSSCTKEQMALNALYGTWELEEQLDSDGDVVPQTGATGFPVGTYTDKTEVTFYRCNDKEEESCTAVSVRTRNFSYNDGTTDESITSDQFNYKVFAKEQMVLDGQVVVVEKLTKKEFSFHPVNAEKATTTYKKK
jgi:hypothetical protein